MDRFPDALRNSYRKPPRSGILVSHLEICFELGRRQIAERGVKPPLVIDFLQELSDRSLRIAQVSIFVP
jgi:hypothetical protein